MTKKQVIAITGCGGMLGEAVYPVFSERYQVYASDVDVNESWLESLDVTDKNAVREHLEHVKPDAIVHLAAWTDMEHCQRDPEAAYDANMLGVANTLAYARRHDIPFVYISTAGIFDGEKDSYDEDDEPNPLSVYGKSKYGGELLVVPYGKGIVVRAGWMMGGGPKKDKKFINKFIRQIRDGKKELHAVHDKIGTPCYTYDLARALVYLLEHGTYGLFHGACDGGASRYDVAHAVIEDLGLHDSTVLTSVDSSFFAKEFFAPRPPSEQMNNNRLKALNPHLTRHWRDCVREYMQKFNWLEPDNE